MPILSSDIKLRASERMTDTTDGGGRRTLNLIEDGVAGNIFPKVSRVDSVYGRVNLRKVYGHVDTAGIDTYAGAHFIVTDAPDNDRIHVTAFSTASEYDTRTAARDRIESYVIAGPESRMVLYGRQLVGSQALLAYQRVEEPLPEIGEVYAVSTEVAGVTSAQQFVRIQDVTQEVRSFVDLLNNSTVEYTYRVITMLIGAPLRYEFNGPATPAYKSGAGAVTGRLRSTTVADASRYFGIQPLSYAALMGDLTLGVDSVYTPIVPTTQRETAMSLASIAGSANLTAISTSLLIVPGTVSYANGLVHNLHLGRSAKPGSIVYTVTSYANSIFRDNGSGGFIADPGVTLGLVLSVDYSNGVITNTSPPSGSATGSQTVSVSFAPVVDVSQAAHTREIAVTLATRGTVYTLVLQPLPAPGTLIVDYRALGKWYRLRDDGAGELTGGDAAYGTGTVNYVTGGVIVTLGALPDVGSSVLLSWGSPAHYEIKTNDAGSTAKFAMALPDLPVKRASVVVTYYINAVATTALASAQGLITGTNSVTGSINHVTGELLLEFGAKLPDAGSSISVAYQQSVPVTAGELPMVVGTFPSLTSSVLNGYPIDPGSVSLQVPFRTQPNYNNYPAAQIRTLPVVDDGLGQLILKAGNGTLISFVDSRYTDFVVVADTVVGTINYSTGAIALSTVAVVLTGKRWTYSWGGGGGGGNIAVAVGGWTEAGLTTTIDPAGTSSYSLRASAIATSDAARTKAVTTDTNPLQVDLLRTVGRTVVAGSVMFALAGKTYIDRNGTVYTDIDAATGAGLAAGTIDYTTGLVTLSQWAPNANAALAVQSCLTKFGLFTAWDAFFRVAGSPLRPASLYVQVTAEDGTLITGLADQDGIIAGTYMRGEVEQTMGVVWVQFGQMVTAAGNELEPWYDAANVVGANVWKPQDVQPGTLRYSAVVLSNLPLNADILGLDPVRLPSDGRVPIYRPADVVVVHNTLSYNAGTPTAAQVLNMGRTDLAALWLEDANKLKLSTALYAADLVNGTVTMAADLSLTGYVTPITAKHRIEEMGLLSDVQINGQITLTAPLLRAYPLGSFVSSALLFGDLFARVTGVFDQNTWSGTWSNALIGSAATAQYNDVDYPIAVLNSAAVSDRWRINFTSSTAFQVISENMGVIGTGTTTVNLAPVNPLTGAAYFTLQAAGWGGGWAVGNQLRFNTVGAVAPVWLARTVLPGATLLGDSFDAQLRGDVD